MGYRERVRERERERERQREREGRPGGGAGVAGCGRVLRRVLRWEHKPAKFEGYVTKLAPHQALKSIAWCKLTFDERFVVHRVVGWGLGVSAFSAVYFAESANLPTKARHTVSLRILVHLMIYCSGQVSLEHLLLS